MSSKQKSKQEVRASQRDNEAAMGDSVSTTSNDPILDPDAFLDYLRNRVEFES